MVQSADSKGNNRRNLDPTIQDEAAVLPQILAATNTRRWLLGSLTLLLLGLIVAGFQNQYQLNTEGVAYLILGGHYAKGNFAQAISGYWSPLFSWFIAALLKLGLAPLTACRLAMAISALVFWAGSISLFNQVRCSKVGFIVSSWLISIAVIYWSVENIGPDLLAAGFMLFGISALIQPAWADQRWKQIATASWWGLAVLTKSFVAFPAALITILAFAVLHRLTGLEAKRIGSALLCTLGSFMIVVGPWITILSLKYDRFVVSTSWSIERSIAGPDDIERYHPCFVEFQRPSQGRFTNWEDPSILNYQSWPISESSVYRSHQKTLLMTNLVAIWQVLNQFALWGFAVVVCVGCFATGRASLETERWCWLALPVLIVILSHLPFKFLAFDTRLFYIVYPTLLIAAFGLAAGVLKRFKTQRSHRLIGVIAVALMWLIPVGGNTLKALDGFNDRGSYTALELAGRMATRNLVGPIAGSAIVDGNRSGLYTAVFLGVPWYGDVTEPSLEAYRGSGARFIVVNRHRAIASSMDFSVGFRNLDPILFDAREDTEVFPLKVYEMLSE